MLNVSEGWETVDYGNHLFALFPFLTSSESEVRENKGVNRWECFPGKPFSSCAPITKAPAKEEEMGQHVNNFSTSAAAAGELNHSE